MLARSHRLPSLFVRTLLQNGQRISQGSLRLYYKQSGETSRFGVIVGRRIDKRATARNRQRRLIHEALRLLLPRLARSVEGVFMLQRPLPVDSIKEVKPLVEALLKKAGLL